MYILSLISPVEFCHQLYTTAEARSRGHCGEGSLCQLMACRFFNCRCTSFQFIYFNWNDSLFLNYVMASDQKDTQAVLGLLNIYFLMWYLY